MKYGIIASLTLFCVMAIILAFSNPKSKPTAPQVGPKVAATIFPLYDITRRIAGKSADVVLILPPGTSPHAYDPSPSDIRNLAEVDVVFAIGHSLDSWSKEMTEAVGISKTVIVDWNIALKEYNHHDDEQKRDIHPDEGTDPHYWLSPKNAILIAATVRDELSKSFPENKALYNANFVAIQKDFIKLDAEVREDLSLLSELNIATFHNAFAYFAEDYGITIVSVFEEYPGQEPSTSYIEEFSEKIRSQNVRAIFSEPQFSPKALLPIANDHEIRVATLDPVGGTDSKTSYESLLRYNKDMIIRALLNDQIDSKSQ